MRKKIQSLERASADFGLEESDEIVIRHFPSTVDEAGQFVTMESYAVLASR